MWLLKIWRSEKIDLMIYTIHEIFHDGGPYHIETSLLTCRANQWTGFYMTGASVMKELSKKSISFQKALMGDKKVHRFHAILISSHCAITKIQIQNITQNVGMYQKMYKVIQCLKLSMVLLKKVFWKFQKTSSKTHVESSLWVKLQIFVQKELHHACIFFLNLMLELPKAKFRTLSRGQPQSLDVNHYVVLSSLEPQVTGSIVKRLGPWAPLRTQCNFKLQFSSSKIPP